MHRRTLLRQALGFPAIHLAAQSLPGPAAVQIGDVTPTRATIWARSAGSLTVKWSASPNDTRTLRGPALTASTDFTGRVHLQNLPPGQQISFEVANGSQPLRGTFRTPPLTPSDIRFLWSGDMAGQGWGINPDRGGIRIFESMRARQPHFFLHSGDTVYADSPIPHEVKLFDGTIWKNVTTPEKSKVAEALDEFRGCYRYNLLDEHVRRFSAEVPQIWQWDDHEFTNNWSPSKDLTADDRYREKNIPLLLARARRAFLEYAPFSSPQIYRSIAYGPLLDVFVIDMRTYRGPNTYNRQPSSSPETVFLGRPQLNWLVRALRSSRATWKVIASDMPLGLIVPDGKDAQDRERFENSANGDGPPLGRELEIARLLTSIREIRNTVWLTADVHYTAAHFYHPEKAKYTEFRPFWEFVSGPLNAGTFGPAKLDNTFGPQVVFQKAPPPGRSNLSPAEGYQFFGEVNIDGRTRELSVTLRDLAGAALYSKTLSPEL